MSQKKPFAILVSAENRPFQDLKAALKRLEVETYSATDCEQVARLLDQTHPELIFTAALLSDRTWRDVVRLSENASVPTSVIVVGEFKDARLFVSSLDYGAFDCVFPPFEEDSAIARVVRMASESTRHRRESQALSAVA